MHIPHPGDDDDEIMWEGSFSLTTHTQSGSNGVEMLLTLNNLISLSSSPHHTVLCSSREFCLHLHITGPCVCVYVFVVVLYSFAICPGH